jgi:pSer/pThr/pTyr-binding forkhead associated (FHA) protein
MPITVVIHGTEPPQSGTSAGDPPPTRLTFDAPRVVVGRGESCDVRLPDRSVSHRHMSLRQRGGEVLVVDEGSTNGTVVERVAIGAQSTRVVRDGDRVRLGRVFLELRLGAEVPTTPAAAKEAAIALVVEALAREGEDGRPRAHVVEGPDAGKDVRIVADRRVVLGRTRDADLVLEDTDASRRHVELGLRGDAVVVRDLGSRTGTRIGERAVASTDIVWKPGERLEVAGNVLELEFAALEELADIERAPDDRVPAGSLPWPDAQPIVEAPSDEGATPDEAPDDEDEDDEEAALKNRRVTKAIERKPTWAATDFAVVLLALGVFSLVVVGYLVLLRR